MKSLRTRITVMTLCIVLAAVLVVTTLTVLFIRKNEHHKSDQLMLVLCETGEKNLNYYFNSVQKSVEKVASFAEADISGVSDEQLQKHVDRVGEYFDEMASKANGVLTYYYRIDPVVSKNVKGFWFTDLDGKGFVSRKVTDITLYNTSDTSKLVWFTVPKYKGESIWLPPYITDNLGKRVISYNVPIYYTGQFIGVVGIEIDYSTMAEQVDNIRLFDSGYAFLSDFEGNLFYHPKIDVTQLTDENKPEVPDGLLSESTFIQYNYEGVEKVAAWLPLSNGMRLNVTAPLSEAEGDWQSLIINVLIVALEVLLISSIITLIYTKRISSPLKQLLIAAEGIDKGNFDFSLEYDKNDEIGRLTKTFKRMAYHMNDYISSLNREVYVDALTRVKNKGAYGEIIRQLQEQIDEGTQNVEFAFGVFDCDDLKKINDQFGHDKGDIYLRTACKAICNTFVHSPVFRIGGDEFAVVLRDDEYDNRDTLIKQFEKAMSRINNTAEKEWEKVNVSFGVAIFDKQKDTAVIDVARRADKIMYENKRERKNTQL